MDLTLDIDRRQIYAERQAWAQIKLDGTIIFEALVYDNPENPAEQNIVNLFAHRLREALERD